MRGPYWNHGKTGVTGEAPAEAPKAAPVAYVTAEVDGETRTYLGTNPDLPEGAKVIEKVGH